VLLTLLSPAVLTLLGSAIVTLVKAIRKKKAESIKERLKHKKIIGVFDVIPPKARKLPDFTDLDKAILDPSPQVVLHCKDLSYALVHCDFVAYNKGADPKIISPESRKWNDIID
jgi:hypothetical protein